MSKQKPREINIKFKSVEEVKEYAANQNRLLLLYEDYVLDATSFAKHHPGGAGLVMNYRLKDVKTQMDAHHELSLIMANSMIIGTFQQQIKRLIDPNEPLMPQIWKMDHQTYLKVVNSPHWLFVNSPRMFAMDILQPLSHNKWKKIFFLPFIVSLIYIQRVSWTGFNPVLILPFLLLGILTFTLTQYLIHRFIFHSERYLPDSKIIRYLHFILHGIHHMLPVDPDRLVYPPSLAVLTFLVGKYTVIPFIWMGNEQNTCIFWIGFFIGYLMYDLTHYALHHIDTSKNKKGYFHRLQQYHNQHHFGGEQLGFGVSSKLWDIIFRTQMSKKSVH